MTAYRFCRTDDMGRLVEAHNHCWRPDHPADPPLTLAEFKGLVRERQLWCSSCLIAYEGEEPVGFVFGCKREKETLLHRFAVHPSHRRHGHGRHLLTSISSKAAILGPPRLVVEVPEGGESGLAILRVCGYVQEETLIDWRRPNNGSGSAGGPTAGTGPPSEIGPPPEAHHEAEGLVIPVTAAELQANGLLADPSPCPAWERAAPSLLALGERLAGTALVVEERLAASILYMTSGPGGEGRILRLAASDPVHAGAQLARLLRGLLQRQDGPWVFPRALPSEPAVEALARHGFHPAARVLRMAAVAQPA
jgi:GNAT superfamily N-acetyltransferase